MLKADKKLSTAKQPVKKNPVGAPRTVSPSPEDTDKLGQEMVKWFIDNPDAVHFSDWYGIEKKILQKDWKALVQLKEFLAHYETVRHMLKKRMTSGIIKDSFGHRYLTMLDTELRDHERAIKQEDAEIKAAEQKSFTADDEARLATLMLQIQSLQAKKSSS